jgi:hypothetical protein
MRNAMLPVAAVIGLSCLAAGCAAQPGAAAGGTRAAAETQAGVVACPRGVRSPVRALTISSSAAGKTLCASIGEHVWVWLRGTPTARWAPIRADSGALAPAPDGRLALMAGVTAAAFTAAHPGTVHLTSARRGCATGGTAGCATMTVFRVTLVISPAPR